MDRKACGWRPFFMSQRGDSGQKKMPTPRMKEGMNAEPSWSRQAMSPVSLTMTLAQKPRKMPGKCHRQCGFVERFGVYDLPITTHNCQNITSAPRIRAGAISAE